MFETTDIIREEAFKSVYFLLSFFCWWYNCILPKSNRIYLKLSRLIKGTWGKWWTHIQYKNQELPAMWETWVQSLGWDNPLEKGKATHSSILTWRLPKSDTTKWLSLHKSRKGKTVSPIITMNPIRYLWINLKRMVPYKYKEKLWNPIEVHQVKS